jgi:hypothetical protein
MEHVEIWTVREIGEAIASLLLTVGHDNCLFKPLADALDQIERLQRFISAGGAGGGGTAATVSFMNSAGVTGGKSTDAAQPRTALRDALVREIAEGRRPPERFGLHDTWLQHARHLAAEVLAYRATAARAVTIADEAFGLGPVEGLDETLGRIEAGINRQHMRISELETKLKAVELARSASSAAPAATKQSVVPPFVLQFKIADASILKQMGFQVDDRHRYGATAFRVTVTATPPRVDVQRSTTNLLGEPVWSAPSHGDYLLNDSNVLAMLIPALFDGRFDRAKPSQSPNHTPVYDTGTLVIKTKP